MAVLTPASVFRRFEVDGVESSGKHKPEKAEIIQLLNQLFGTSRGGWVVAQTKAELDGITPESETDGGVVLTGDDAGYYDRDGGVWVFGRGFPDTFARVELSGTSTAQTGIVQAGVNPSVTEVFFAFVEADNTGPLTLSIAGEAPREVVNLAGNPLAAGEWTGTVMFALRDDKYQLLIDAGAASSAAQSASDAADQKAYAEEWAQSDDPISVEAGGNGATDRSSKWWAGEASNSADRAEAAAAGVEFPVSYGAPQALSEPQKDQAKENIGLLPADWEVIEKQFPTPAAINVLVIGDSLMVGREAGGREDWAPNVTLWNNPNNIDSDNTGLGTTFVLPDIDNPPFDSSNNNLGIQAISHLGKTFPVADVKGVVISCGGREFDDFVDSSNVKQQMFLRMDAIIPLTGLSLPFDAIFIHLGTNNAANANLGVVPTQAANLVGQLISSGYATSSTPIIFGQSSTAWPALNPVLETIVGGNNQLGLALTSGLPADGGHFLGPACFDAGWQYLRALSRVPDTPFSGFLDPIDLDDVEIVVSDNDEFAKTEPGAITDGRRKEFFVAGKFEAQTGITSNTPTQVTFPAVDHPHENYDSALSRWTPSAGPVHIEAAIQCNNVTAGTACNMFIYKNGGVWRHTQTRGPTSCWTALSVDDVASGDDYYEVFIQFTHGGTGELNVRRAVTRFSGYKI